MDKQEKSQVWLLPIPGFLSFMDSKSVLRSFLSSSSFWYSPMSKIIPILLLFLTSLGMAKDRLMDEADLYTEAEENALEKILEQKSLEGQIDLYFLTRTSLHGDETRYAAEYFHVQEGRGLVNGGAVFIIDMERRDMGIYTFGPAISHFANFIDPILDSIAPLLIRKRYDFAAREYANQMASMSSQNIFILASQKAIVVLWTSGISWVFILGIPLIVVLVLSRQNKSQIDVNPKTYLVKDSFHMRQSEDKYLRTTESRVYNPPQKSSSSGSSGSGRSSGGGSRKF